MKTKNVLCGLAMAVVLHLSVPASSAQTYLYSYTGNDFTSASGPYTTSDKITANIILSAPLGANYEGSPSATLLNFGINDGVYQDLPSLPNNYVQDFTFGTDSSGNIVSWNFEMISFHEYLNPIQAVTMITIDQPGDVMDSTSIDTQFANLGAESVTADPGVWVETVVPEPSAGLLFVSFAPLVLAFGRFKPSQPRVVYQFGIKSRQRLDMYKPEWRHVIRSESPGDDLFNDLHSKIRILFKYPGFYPIFYSLFGIQPHTLAFINNGGRFCNKLVITDCKMTC